MSVFVIPSTCGSRKSRTPRPCRPDRGSRGRRTRLSPRRTGRHRRQERHRGPAGPARCAHRGADRADHLRVRQGRAHVADGVLRREPAADHDREDVPVHHAGDRRLRGHPVLCAQRSGREGRGAGFRGQPEGRRRLAGRIDADHAVRADGVAGRCEDAEGGAGGDRADGLAETARDAARHRAREDDQQVGDPRAVPELGIFRPSGVRDLCGFSGFLLEDPGGSQPQRGGPAGGPGEGAVGLRPGEPGSGRGDHAAQLRDRPDDQDGVDHAGPSRGREEGEDQAEAEPAAERLRVDRAEAQRLGFLLRLLQVVVEGAAGVRGRIRRNARKSCGVAAIAWSRRSIRRSRRRP